VEEVTQAWLASRVLKCIGIAIAAAQCAGTVGPVLLLQLLVMMMIQVLWDVYAV